MTPLDPTTVPLRGTNLIEASAGTGKTYTITTLYVRLLLELQLPVAEILVVTYTNAATAELRARIRRRLRAALAALDSPGASSDATLDQLVEQRRAHGTLDTDRRVLTAALRGFDEAAISTIHGFCQRMLRENAFESGISFDTQLVTDQTPLQDEVLYDFWTRELHAAPQAFVRHLQHNKVTLEKLASLAHKVIAHPDMPVVPESPSVDLTGSVFTAKLAAWGVAHAEAATIWSAQREKILTCLCDSNDLKKNMYKPDSIRGPWATQMDCELAAAQPGLGMRFAKFEKFTTNGLAQGTKKNGTAPVHRFFKACEALLTADAAVERDMDARVLQLQLEFVRYARLEVKRRQEVSRTQSFDDLLHGLRDALNGPGGDSLAGKIRSRFRAALIDEFQDTDPVQYEIFRRVYHGGDAVLFLVGDPKQAIYAFRGADVFAYLRAKRDAPASSYTLDTNWRSGPRLVRAVNSLFKQAQAQFVFPEIPFREIQPAPQAAEALGGAAAGRAPLQFLFMRCPADATNITKERANDELPGTMAAEIVRLLTSGATIGGRDIGPGDIAVLCRTNEQARTMQRALRARRVPSVLQGDSSVFDAPEAHELERALRAIADPGDMRALRAALSTTLMGLSGETLLALQSHERDWDAWVERFQRWHAVWVQQGFMPAFRRMLDEHRVQPRLLELTDGERRLTNVLHLGELLQTAGIEAHRGPLSLVEWLRLMRNDVKARGEVVADAAQIRLESDARATRLVTIHKSKGLEYPVVFCPYLWDGLLLRGSDKEYVRFHDADDEDRLTLDLAPDSPAGQRHLAQAGREALAENLRLLYVALTRAKHRCSVVWGKFHQAESSPLAYLLHQPRPVPRDTDLAAATANRVKLLNDDALLADLTTLAATADGTVEIAELSSEPCPPYEPDREEARDLRYRETDRVLHRGWRASSFSALVSGAAEVSMPAGEGLDHDEAVDDAAPAHGSALVVLHEFPAGAESGQLIHEIFQYLDFQQHDPTVLQGLVKDRLGRYGVDQKWLAPLCRAIGDTLATPLERGRGALRLRDIPRHRRLNELEFTLPVASRRAEPASGANEDGRAMLTPARLAGAFARHGAAPLPRDYAEQVRLIRFTALAGYLRGFIDLAFEHAGRWYVVDYKSNRLGTNPHDYRRERLAAVMAHRHYYLQYHLYAVAVHRYLAVRVPDYDYEQHFGGVYYLFMRGMSPEHDPGCGVFYDRPSRALIEDLSAVLGRPGDDR